MIKKTVIISLTIFIIILNLFQSATTADKSIVLNQGFDKGVSWKNVVPLKKVTFVNYDEESYLDDYAYLASVPSAVFYDQDKLYSNPLLFYQDQIKNINQKELPLYSRNGIDYFMEDWASYCGDRFDEIVGVNVCKKKLNSWRAKTFTEINGDNALEIANDIALHYWSYSKNVVIAVIDEQNEKTEIVTTNKLKYSLPANDVYKHPTINIKQTNSLNPVFKDFEVNDKYKFINAVAWWDGLILGGHVVIPTGDPDLQLYFKEEKGWIQTTAAAFYNLFGPTGYEITKAHIYKPGSWRICITDFPTEGDIVKRKGLKNIFEIQGSLLGMLKAGVTYHVDITMYPGINLKIPDTPPFGCKDVEFKLTWKDQNANLGFTIIGPAGEAIYTEINESKTGYQEIHFESLGECLPNENYSISVLGC